MAQTVDQIVAEVLGSKIDERIGTLNQERARLVSAPARILEIDAELAILQPEKARIDPRRPSATVITATGVDVAPGQQGR
jgi:uncharacterized small protein (DUF1192 family)